MISLDQAGRGMAWSRVVSPPTRLSSTVEHGWISVPPHDPPTPANGSVDRGWKIVPDLSPNLLVHRTGGGVHVTLVGARSRAADIDIRDRLWTAGLRLVPGSLPVLTGMDAHELTDRGGDPEILLGPAARTLKEILQESDRPDRALRALFAFVEGIAPRRTADWRIRAILSDSGGAPPSRVATLTRSSGVSRRTLQSAAKAHLGVSPKTALRIRRLQAALQKALAAEEPRWSRIAWTTGYCDGAHLSREFAALLGEAPGRWRTRREGGSLDNTR